ncbi:asparagine synthase (glutamine-hydrolyzing) [Nemorincola caseinilytica]|uniref:asparagine synthase (glutamine-hydrolyzing) n=1 Tax=Nemorincola caseinilytica TaxID=2054315 RepID=A0ABP8N8P0_9BACT
MSHRGPDGSRTYEDIDIGLVHTRLSIIDLTESGNQPLYNEDSSLVLVCNGEIYNYQAVRKELQEKGHEFRSHSDCEVILHLYEEYKGVPEKVLERLTGMFAFALWDTKKEILLIARDRLGIKPLYYSRKGDTFIFSSEIRPIVNCGLVDTTTDHTSIYEYLLTGSVPAPNTIYNEVKCLEPGYYAIVRDSRMNTMQYWDIPIRDGNEWKSEEAVLEATTALLKQVVRDHLVADVPVGTFLSAGVDSSLITAMAVEVHPGIHSFTASFPGEPEDEGVIAASSAKKLRTTHHSYEIKGDFFNDISEQFRYMDQPFAISSALSLGRISLLARKDVKVVLSGDGGDELFGGYTRHAQPAVPGFLKYIPAGMQDNALKIGARLTGKQSLAQLRNNLKIPPAQTFFDRTIVSRPEWALACLNPDIARKVDTQRYMKRLKFFFDRTEGADMLSRVLYTDMKTTLVDEMLTKCDRMTMRNGIEGRVPLLDHRMVEMAFSIPSAYKRQGDTGKVPLRKMLARYLGNDLAFRQKTGFNSPLKQWLQSDPATYGYAQQWVNSAGDIPFLNKEITGATADNIKDARQTEVFGLVCLAHFYGRKEA